MKCLLIIPAVCLCSFVFAQFNPLQTQYMYNPMVINPACSGEIGYMSATLSARRQWWGFDGAPETFVFTCHTPVRNLHHNTGIVAAQDNLGVVHKTELSLSYAYRIIAQKFSFAAGVAPGIDLFRNNWSEVVTNTQGDLSFSANETSRQFVLGYGVYFNSKRIFFGFSNRIVSGNNFKLTDQPFQFYGGMRFGDPDRVQVELSTLSRALLNGIFQADVNANCTIRQRIGFGFGYRYTDALIAMLNVKLNDQVSIGYSYDYCLSGLARYNSGSHEIVLRYDFGYTVQRSNPRFR